MGTPGKEQLLADISPHYELLGITSLFGDGIANSGFCQRQERCGAHLHWTLPDALLNGVQDPDGTLHFPALPNRWLVVRLETSGGTVQRKAWLVQSDALSSAEVNQTNKMSRVSIPCLSYSSDTGLWEPAGKDGSYGIFLGTAVPYNGTPDEPEASLDKLTAVGAGDHLFSALYPLCQTVFGFYDPLDGVEEGTFTYLVCGSYSRDGDDPLSGTDPLEAAKELGWSWAGGETPDSVLCHGAVSGVVWKGPDNCYNPPRTDSVDLVLANSSSEALACYLQNQMPQVEGLERMLCALSCGLMDELDAPDRSDPLISMEENLHERQFGASSEGETLQLCSLDGSERLWDNALTPEADQAVRQALEMAQAKSCAYRLHQTYARYVYLYWHRYLAEILSLAGGDGSAERAQLEQALDTCRQAADRQAEAEQKLGPLLQQANTLLADQGLCLRSCPEERFFRPNSPVLLLAQQMQRRYRTGLQDETSGTLPCRMHPVSDLSLPEVDIQLTQADLNGVWGTLSTPLPASVQALCVETVLLDPGCSALLADLAQAKTRHSTREEVLPLVEQAQKTHPNRPADSAYKIWRRPWNPILMEWEVKIRPARGCQSDDTFSKFHLGELDWEGDAASFAGKEFFFQGRTLLTPHAVLQMQQSLRRLAQRCADTDPAKEQLLSFADRLSHQQILSQQLSGFSEWLCGMQYVPYLPILAPTGNQTAQQLARRVQEVLLENYPVTCPGRDAACYLPICGGAMQLSRLRLVDTFGQFQDIPIEQTTLLIGENLHTTQENTALLPPRFAQGIRLSFQWMDASQPTRIALDANSSPVCGFLLANLLNRSLQIYTPSGAFLGWLQQTDNGIRWRSAPGSQWVPPDKPKTQLDTFIKAVLGWPADNFLQLLDQVSRYLSARSQAPRKNVPASRFGAVLALARCAVSVEMESVPEPFWGEGNCDTNGYEKATFPVRMGDGRRFQEGLVGFFPDVDGVCPYDRIHPAASAESDPALSFSLVQPARTMTLLLDPWGEVTLRTGFLPARHVSLPPQLYQQQVEEMEPLFHLWPVLSLGKEVTLPVADLGASALSFLQVQPDQTVRRLTLTHRLSPLLPTERPQILEGYLTLQRKETTP